MVLKDKGSDEEIYHINVSGTAVVALVTSRYKNVCGTLLVPGFT